MYMQDKLNTTGETVVLNSHRAPGFEFVAFELLDSPSHMPAGSMVSIDCAVLDADGCVMPSVSARGW